VRKQCGCVVSGFWRCRHADLDTQDRLCHLKPKEAAARLFLPHQMLYRLFCFQAIEQMGGNPMNAVSQ
jgi:hypothetical protein